MCSECRFWPFDDLKFLAGAFGIYFHGSFDGQKGDIVKVFFYSLDCDSRLSTLTMEPHSDTFPSAFVTSASAFWRIHDHRRPICLLWPELKLCLVPRQKSLSDRSSLICTLRKTCVNIFREFPGCRSAPPSMCGFCGNCMGSSLKAVLKNLWNKGECREWETGGKENWRGGKPLISRR